MSSIPSKSAVLVLACACAPATQAAEKQRTFGEIVEEVNAAREKWTAGIPSRFKSHDDVRAVCGTILEDGLWGVKDRVQASASVDATDAFDLRSKWPACTVISHVSDQGPCGSCWAFASTQAFESSLCIATGADVALSKQDTAECCAGNSCGYSKGCEAGTPRAALDWMMRSGVVTGGDYGAGSGCKSYALEPCSHDGDPSSPFAPCKGQEEPVLVCSEKCTNSEYPSAYADDKVNGDGSAVISGLAYRDGGAKMMEALAGAGPISASMTVMEDFPTYKSGVYKHLTGNALGGHAVLVVGWGVLPADESGNVTPYWIVKNSWSESWGEDGFFRMVRGANEVGIEGAPYVVSFNGWSSSGSVV